MSRKDYGIESIADAFLALKDMKEEIEIPNAKRKGLKEAASVDVRSPEDVELAQDFRRNDKKEEDSELEVIDVDADSVENLQDGKSYIGKMLLQCNSCKATRFIDVDKLVADENDKELYNVEDECPHCHNKGTGYALIGQVGKTAEENPEDEASLDNDTNNGEEAMFDNTDEVEPESEETPAEGNTESNEESSSDEETNYDETNAEDDTNDMELPELGDEFDVDDVMDDDTEDEDDKTKKESLNEDRNDNDLSFIITYRYDGSPEKREFLSSRDEAVDTFEEMCEDEDLNYAFLEARGIDGKGEEFYHEIDSYDREYDRETKKESLNESPDRYGLETDDEIENAYQSAVDDADKQRRHAIDDRENLKNKYILRVDLRDNGDDGVYYINKNYENTISDEWYDFVTNEKDLNNVNDLITFNTEAEALKFRDETEYEIFAYEMDYDEIEDMYYPIKVSDLYKNESLDEKLDMSTFEGSIANLVDTFTIEDNPVNIKLLNKNGSELGMYGSDDLPFNVKSQMMDTFNTDDNYLEVNVTENGDGTTVNDLFNYYRPDEENQTTFVVTNVDTDEEEDFEDLTEFLEKYGDYYIDGALGLRTLNIYIADGDLETEVEPLDDEEIEELGKENAEKEEAEVTEESLVEEIIKSYPGLKLNRINNSLSEEYFIADSIKLNEDLDLVYKNFVKPTNNERLIEHFKSYTGYEDDVDKFLKEHNISKDKYKKIINESPDELGLATEDEIEGTYQAAVDDADKQRRHAIDDRENTLNKYVVFLDLDRNGNEHKGYVNSEFDSEEFYWGDVITPLSNINDLYLFDSYDEALEAMNQIIDQAEDMSSKAIENGDDTKELKVLERKIKQVKELYNSTTTNEKLLCSVKDRKELGETINKLVEANEKYRISKSLTEGYRYDIFVNENCKLNEGLFDENEIEVVGDDVDAEAADAELVDNTPTTDVEEPLETTDVVPADMNPKEVEVVQKIDRIANDIAEAIADTYNVDAQKNLIVADIVQDLQLIGGAKVADDLKETPINELTKQMYQDFNGLFDKEEDSANKLAFAMAMLDSDQFSTETIKNQIASPRFLKAAKAGYIPFINAAQLAAPVDESLNEESEMNDDNSSIEDCKTRYEELTYLATQRELTVEEQEDLAYCEKRLVNYSDDLSDFDERLTKEDFDNCINEYLNESYTEDNVAYRTLTIEKLQQGIKVNGIIEGLDEDKEVSFTLKPVLNESNNSTDRYIVTNSLNDKKFNLDL